MTRPQEFAADRVSANGGDAMRQWPECEDALRLMADALPVMISYIDREERYCFANLAHEKFVGISREKIYGMRVRDVLGEPMYELIRPHMARALAGQPVSYDADLQAPTGQRCRADVHYAPHHAANGTADGFFALASDVTERHRWEALFRGEARVLELLATGRPLPEILSSLVLMIEGQSPGVLGSVLLLDENDRLRHGAAPSLPEPYCQAVDGLPIGEGAGSCGTAARRRQRVIVEDVLQDPLWASYRELAQAHELRACWSEPIMDEDERVLGTFALYYREPRGPSPRELRLIETAAYVARLAIERTSFEQTLRHEQRRFQTLMDHVPETIYFKDADSRFTRINTALAKFLGVSDAGDAIGRTDADFFPPAAAAEYRRDEEMVMRTGRPMLGKIEHDGRPGATRRWYSTTKIPLLSPDGRIVGTAGVSHELTDRMRLEQVLRKTSEDVEQRVKERTSELRDALARLERETEERRLAEEARNRSDLRYRSVVETALNVIICLDPQYRILEWNGAAEEVFGWSREQVLGRDYVEMFLDPESRPHVIEDIHRIMSGNTTSNFENDVRARDGSARTLLWNVTPLPGDDARPHGVIAIGQDITERKDAEHALREKEERIRQIAEHIREVFWLVECEDGRMVYVSPGYEKIWGRPVDQIYANQSDWLEAIHVDDRQRIHEAFSACFTHGEFDEEYRITRPDGTERWIRDRGFPVRDDAGRIYRIAGIAEDISAQKEAAAILRDSEERYRLLVEGVKYVAWEFDRATRRFTFVSQHAETLLGFTREEWMEPDFWRRQLHPDDRERMLEFSRAHSEQGLDNELEYRMVTKSGETVWIKDISTIVSTTPTTTMRGVFIDVTARKEAEEESREHQARLAHVAHLSTMVVMAVSLSHELNQPLQAILNYVLTCTQELDSGRPDASVIRADLDQIANHAQRATDIMSRLRNFARSESSSPERTDLNDFIRNAVHHLGAAARHARVTLRTRLGEDLPEVHIDVGQFEQALLNLAYNGIEAIRESGAEERVLTIGARLRHTGTADTIELSCEDTGPGLPDAMCDQIFDPFFTTKTTGMGLGLTLSRRIVDLHGGTLTASNRVSGGACFTIALPVTEPGYAT